jgi:hypothetical protein
VTYSTNPARLIVFHHLRLIPNEMATAGSSRIGIFDPSPKLICRRWRDPIPGVTADMFRGPISLQSAWQEPRPALRRQDDIHDAVGSVILPLSRGCLKFPVDVPSAVGAATHQDDRDRGILKVFLRICCITYSELELLMKSPLSQILNALGIKTFSRSVHWQMKASTSGRSPWKN